MRFIKDIKKYFRYVMFSGQSELKAEVANSYLNWLWWIIEPICFMLIYSFVFGYLFGAKEDHFSVFVYIGITMWNFFSRMLNSSVQIIRNNKAIVSKVYIPKYMLLLVKMYVNTFKTFISMIILFAMMAVSRVHISWNILWIIPAFITMMFFTFAICSFLLHFGVYVDDLANVVRIVLQMMFYMTGVFYNLTDKVKGVMGERWATIISHGNPMASILSDMRDALLYARTPELKYMLFWLALGVIFSAIGIHVIYENENTYVKVI